MLITKKSKSEKNLKVQLYVLYKIQLYAVCKKLTLDPVTDVDWKWKDGKRYPMQIVTRRELGWLYYIHQNRL